MLNNETIKFKIFKQEETYNIELITKQLDNGNWCSMLIGIDYVNPHAAASDIINFYGSKVDISLDVGNEYIFVYNNDLKQFIPEWCNLEEIKLSNSDITVTTYDGKRPIYVVKSVDTGFTSIVAASLFASVQNIIKLTHTDKLMLEEVQKLIEALWFSLENKIPVEYK